MNAQNQNEILKTEKPLAQRKIWRTLIRVAWVALAVNSLWTFSWTLLITWELTQNPSPRLRAGLAELGLSPDVYFWLYAVGLTIAFVCYFVVALLIFVRRPNDRMALFVAVFLMAFGAASSYPQTNEFLQVTNSGRLYFIIPYTIDNLLAWPLLVAFFALYPDGVFVPRWMRYLAVYGFFFGLAWGSFPQAFAAPQGWLAAFILVSVILVFGVSLYAQVYRYRHRSTPLQRQQTKWMVYGFGVLVLVTIAQQFAITVVLPSGSPTAAESVILDLFGAAIAPIYGFVPLAVGIAILRYRLYDIDILIRRTLIYASLTALLALVYLGSVILLQQIFRALTGQGQNEIVTVISTLAIAALFIPLCRRVQDVIDHRFYRRKYDAARILATFSATVRDEVNLNELTGHLLTVVEDTMQPIHVSLWLKQK